MGFWISIAVMVVIVVGVSVLVGMNVKDGRKHRLSRDEMMALKTSGAFKERKSSMNGD
ncbi:MAG: hypothetical protein JNM59_10850 [Hyphomonadaceae bacterium]|nr:hypothetical protein [Hyphomonadaceae bacterium]